MTVAVRVRGEGEGERDGCRVTVGVSVSVGVRMGGDGDGDGEGEGEGEGGIGCVGAQYLLVDAVLLVVLTCSAMCLWVPSRVGVSGSGRLVIVVGTRM